MPIKGPQFSAQFIGVNKFALTCGMRSKRDSGCLPAEPLPAP
jgi:hypothetical protein